MQLFLVAFVAGLAAGWIGGGRLRNILELPFLYAPLALVWLALAVQLAMLLVSDALATEAIGASYVLVAAAIALVIRRIVVERGVCLPVWALAIIGVGWLLNVVVMTANGGMPFDADALVQAGMSPDMADHGVLIPKRLPLTDHSQLAFLGDVILLPGLRILVSLGDIVLAIGIAALLFSGMRSSEWKTTARAVSSR